MTSIWANNFLFEDGLNFAYDNQQRCAPSYDPLTLDLFAPPPSFPADFLNPDLYSSLSDSDCSVTPGSPESLQSSPIYNHPDFVAAAEAWQPATYDPFLFPSRPSAVSFAFDSNGNCFTVAHPAQAVDEQSKKRKSQPEPDSFDRSKAVRPKVVEGKGVQCIGTNRKKKTQCRNAALMEYIGPRPLYCAEHIELDPQSLYEKCKSDYHKEPGDGRGCKEVVLKEFGVCYKHFQDLANEMIAKKQVSKCQTMLERITELTSQLESETAAAKKVNVDLFQRKNKLLPKFLGMMKTAEETYAVLNTPSSSPSDC